MPKINLFNINDDDYRHMQQMKNDKVQVNHEAIVEAFVNFDDFATRTKINISSLKPIKQGDIVTYQEEDYLVTNQSPVKRYESYRAQASLVDFNIDFTIKNHAPIKQVPVLTGFIGGGLSTNEWRIPMLDNKINLTLPYNLVTKDLLKHVGATFFIDVSKYEITSVVRLQRGLINIVGESALLSHDDVTPEEPAVPSDELTTDVTLTYFNDVDGQLEISKETKADDYTGFVGYRFFAMQGTTIVDEEVIDSLEESTTWRWNTYNFEDGVVELYVQSRFIEGENEVLLKPILLDSYEYVDWGW